MKVFKIEKKVFTEEEKKFYSRKGYKPTGEVFYMGDEFGVEITGYVVFKGAWTRTGTVRDCGDHYIYAGYSKYYRIDKDTLEIIADVEDI